MRQMRAADVEASNLDSNRKITAAGGLGGDIDEIGNKGVAKSVGAFSKGAKVVKGTLKTATSVLRLTNEILNPAMDLFAVASKSSLSKFFGYLGLIMTAYDAKKGAEREILSAIDDGTVATQNEVVQGASQGVVQAITGIYAAGKKITMEKALGYSSKDAMEASYGDNTFYSQSGELGRKGGGYLGGLMGAGSKHISLRTELNQATGGMYGAGFGTAGENYLADFRNRKAMGMGVAGAEYGQFLSDDLTRFYDGKIMGADGKPISENAYFNANAETVGSKEYNIAQQEKKVKNEYMRNVGVTDRFENKGSNPLNDYAKRLDALVIEIQSSRAARLENAGGPITVNNNNTTGTSSSDGGGGGGTTKTIDLGMGGGIPGYL